MLLFLGAIYFNVQLFGQLCCFKCAIEINLTLTWPMRLAIPDPSCKNTKALVNLSNFLFFFYV